MEARDQCEKGVSSDVSIPSSPESPPSSSLLSNACNVKLCHQYMNCLHTVPAKSIVYTEISLSKNCLTTNK